MKNNYFSVNNRFLGGVLLIALSLTNANIFKLDTYAPFTVFICIASIYIFIYVKNLRKIPSTEIYGIIILLIFLIISYLSNSSQAKFSSLLFSVFFIVTFFILYTDLRTASLDYISKLSKLIIYLFFTSIVVAQLLIILDFTTLALLLKIIFIDGGSGLPRVSGFSSEPSYTAFIVMSAYYFVLLWQMKNGIFLVAPFLTVLYQIYSLSSVYGYILACILAIYFLLSSNYNNKRLIIFVMLAIVVLTGVSYSFEDQESRIFSLIGFLFSGAVDLDAFNSVDSSAWMRIAPLTKYIENLDLFDLRTYFGFGSSASSVFFTNQFNEHIGGDSGRGSVLELGFFPAFVYDYGVIGVIAFWVVVLKRVVSSSFIVELCFIILMLFNANINTQLFWFVIIFMLLAGNFSFKIHRKL